MSICLAESDPEIMALCREEKERQKLGLELIASENFTSKAVLQALSSSFHNKYSEGQVGARYYGGTEIVDKMEALCKKRALALFDLDESEWGVNVQPYSGSPANFAIYTGLVGLHGRIMGLDLPDGGHLTHGYQAASGRKVSATSLFFESVPYKVDPMTGWIDYERLEIVARSFRPKLIVAGTSAYARHLDYPRFRQIADSVSAVLLADMSHIGGLVAAGLHPSPFKYADVVMTTTHKTIRGPRAAMIFYRKIARSKENGVENGCHTNPTSTDFERRINEAVFPGLQGGPHNNTIAAIAVCLKEAASPEYKVYQEQVLKNMKQLCKSLKAYGYELVTGGSDTHLCLMDLRPLKIDGARAEKVLELVRIYANKNTCPGDVSALRPGGLRFGSAALTSRNFHEEDFVKVSEFIHIGIQIAVKANELANSKLLKDYEVVVETNVEVRSMIEKLRLEIEEFASKYPLPGLDF